MNSAVFDLLVDHIETAARSQFSEGKRSNAELLYTIRNYLKALWKENQRLKAQLEARK